MAAKRFFTQSVGDVVTLEGEEFLHAVNVLRVKVGDEIVLLDNSGKEYSAIIAKINKRDLICNVVGCVLSDKECANEVVLVCGFLKGDKTELIVQKAVELGVSKIVVFTSEFSSAYMNDNKLERLNKVAKESAKQCLRPRYPSVEYADGLKSALSGYDNFINRLFACEFADKSEASLSRLPQGKTVIVVGSEGGFSREEAVLAQDCGFLLVSLGKRILRAETACIALTAIVMQSLGELN